MEFLNRFFAKYPEEKLIRWFKNIAVIEAVTWGFLIIGMVWKRYDPDGLGSLIYIISIGNIHGLFFTLYLILCLPARKIFSWDDEDFVFALLAAFFPFATIWAEKSLGKKDGS